MDVTDEKENIKQKKYWSEFINKQYKRTSPCEIPITQCLQRKTESEIIPYMTPGMDEGYDAYLFHCTNCKQEWSTTVTNK